MFYVPTYKTSFCTKTEKEKAQVFIKSDGQRNRMRFQVVAPNELGILTREEDIMFV
jgi:hypothetical protein